MTSRAWPPRLLYYIARSQGFADGNKRTAVAATTTTTFLHLNGFQLAVTDRDPYDVSIAVATGAMDKDALADWINDHLAAVE